MLLYFNLWYNKKRNHILLTDKGEKDMKHSPLDIKFVSNRITEIRMEHNISEYQLSLDLGFSKGYIQAISSGHILPSLGALYKICEYFEITPERFFSTQNADTPLLQDLLNELRKMTIEEQYALYQFIKGGKMPDLRSLSEANPELPEQLLPESDK